MRNNPRSQEYPLDYFKLNLLKFYSKEDLQGAIDFMAMCDGYFALVPSGDTAKEILGDIKLMRDLISYLWPTGAVEMLGTACEGICRDAEALFSNSDVELYKLGFDLSHRHGPNYEEEFEAFLAGDY